ncbi:MAG: hypothetical protein PGMFKBFP_03238 [Anaerolineales bacterium]|nr:hypothetical protein [Anaerolineales bacterium]
MGRDPPPASGTIRRETLGPVHGRDFARADPRGGTHRRRRRHRAHEHGLQTLSASVDDALRQRGGRARVDAPRRPVVEVPLALRLADRPDSPRLGRVRLHPVRHGRQDARPHESPSPAHARLDDLHGDLHLLGLGGHGPRPGLPRHPLDAGQRAGFARDRGGQLRGVSLVHALHDLHRPARSRRLELAPAPAARLRGAAHHREPHRRDHDVL